MNAAYVCSKSRGIGVFGDGNEDFDIIGSGPTFELGSRLDQPCSVSTT